VRRVARPRLLLHMQPSGLQQLERGAHQILGRGIADFLDDLGIVRHDHFVQIGGRLHVGHHKPRLQAAGREVDRVVHGVELAGGTVGRQEDFQHGGVVLSPYLVEV
jgi:hypothetical protein